MRTWQRETHFLRQQHAARRFRSECRILTGKGKSRTTVRTKVVPSILAATSGLALLWRPRSCVRGFPQAICLPLPGECHSDQIGRKASEGRHGLSPTSPNLGDHCLACLMHCTGSRARLTGPASSHKVENLGDVNVVVKKYSFIHPIISRKTQVLQKSTTTVALSPPLSSLFCRATNYGL